MAITINTAASTEDIEKIAQTLESNSDLTPRTKATLESNRIAVAHDGEKLIGWIISEFLCKNVYEFGGAYVEPSYRRQKILSKLINELTKIDNVYILASYYPYLIRHLCENHGFHISSLLELTRVSRGKFITKRMRVSLHVAQHLAKRRAVYVIRRSSK